jgi:hypothetical protein
MKTVFLRAIEADDKAAALISAIHNREAALGKQRFEVEPTDFASVPRSPFAYWVSERLRRLFVELPRFESDGRTAKHGAATLDDVRFVRSWFEVEPGDPTWVSFAKGGSHAPYYADVFLVLRWSDHGAELKANASAVRARNGWGDQWTAVLNGYDFYFRPGLTWPHRSAKFSAAALPAKCVFSQSGKAAFAPDGALTTLLGLLNASVITLLSRVQSDAVRIKFEVGLIERTPFPPISARDAVRLAELARRAWSLKRSLDTRSETSHVFTLPALLQVDGGSIVSRATAWTEHVRAAQAEVGAIQHEIDQRCFDLYGIDEVDRGVTIEEPVSASASSAINGRDNDADTDLESEPDDLEDAVVDVAGLAAELVSWAVGVAFGRFDVRLATGGRSLPSEPEPFDALPRCSPGMLTGDNGLPLTAPPVNYPLALPHDGILVDDPGHPRDLTAVVRTVFDVVFGAVAHSRWHEAAALLDPKDHDLRAWLASSFFEHHLRRHSKSRRKAPILWQLGTPSGRYSVCLYVHRLTRDSFFQLQNDVVAPKLAHEERRLANLVQGAKDSPSAKERKEIAAQADFVEELRGLLEEVKRVTPLWNPTLDDGVLLVLAPLWRLVPQHKSWQRELKGKWDELATASYEWAQGAMYLWPERVVPKCATDRSLAIAHGVEDIFWVEGADGKWKPRPTPTRAIEDLVRERSSSAVKAALKSLLDAPVVTAGGGRGRRVGGKRREP